MTKTKTEIDKKRLEKLLGNYADEVTDSEKLSEYLERKPLGYWKSLENVSYEI